MMTPRHKFFIVLSISLVALALTAPAAVAEEKAGVIAPEGIGPKDGQASTGKPGPKAVHYGPGFERRGPGMQNGPVGPGTAHRKYVTPYGDFCPLCTNYGIGRKAVGLDHALEAMKDYFSRKGFEIKNVKGAGRFLKAEVFKDGDLVDKILFDRRTGRIRSIY